MQRTVSRTSMQVPLGLEDFRPFDTVVDNGNFGLERRRIHALEIFARSYGGVSRFCHAGVHLVTYTIHRPETGSGKLPGELLHVGSMDFLEEDELEVLRYQPRHQPGHRRFLGDLIRLENNFRMKVRRDRKSTRLN